MVEPMLVSCLDGVKLKIRFARVNPGQTPVQLSSEWKWTGEFGRAMRAVDDLRAMVARGGLGPDPNMRDLIRRKRMRGAPRSPGEEEISAENVTDRALREARIKSHKWRETAADGAVTAILYRLFCGALLVVSPDGRWGWRDRAGAACRAIDEADAAWRRHAEPKRKQAKASEIDDGRVRSNRRQRGPRRDAGHQPATKSSSSKKPGGDRATRPKKKRRKPLLADR
jgi:hypothetical protein